MPLPESKPGDVSPTPLRIWNELNQANKEPEVAATPSRLERFKTVAGHILHELGAQSANNTLGHL